MFWVQAVFYRKGREERQEKTDEKCCSLRPLRLYSSCFARSTEKNENLRFLFYTPARK